MFQITLLNYRLTYTRYPAFAFGIKRHREFVSALGMLWQIDMASLCVAPLNMLKGV